MALSSITKLNDDMIERIIQLVKAGNYTHVACAACGVRYTTFRVWMQRGRTTVERLAMEDVEYEPEDYSGTLTPEGMTYYEWMCYKLVILMDNAEAEAEAYAVLQVRKHMPDQWTAAMTWLERRFPDRWRKRQTLDVGADDGSTGIDERALIEDPRAMALLHEALQQVAQGERAAEAALLPAAGETG